MTELVVHLPDDLAQRAKNAGLLSDGAIQKLLEDAMRRDAGRRLMQAAEQLHAAEIEPMSQDEVMEEVKAARAARKAQDGKKSEGGS